MKGGGAIQLSLLEQYSVDENFKGNLLLIAVPDEENLSAGMRGAITLIKDLKGLYNLNYILMLNAEPHSREDDAVPTIQDGSIGKIMPLIYVRGKLTHAGYIYEGFNPINLLSEIIRRTEINTDFVELVGNTATNPPTWLYSKDVKHVYDVSLPLASVGYMSLLTLERSPKDIFDQLYNIANEAFESVILGMNESYVKYQEIIGKDLGSLKWTPNTKYYSDVYKEALRDSGELFTNAYNVLLKDIKVGIENNELTMVEGVIQIIELTLVYVKDSTPLVILALTPPYYPNVSNTMIPDKASRINDAIEELMDFARNEWDQTFYLQSYFTGISDLSYAMFESDVENIQYIEENMLLWGDAYYIPLEAIKELSMPVLNLGPWGKDFHKYTERVYTEDLYHRTPILIDRLIKKLLY